MAMFRFRNLTLNLGKELPCGLISGCGQIVSACGNFPNTCHVWTCMLGTRICGIPSCNYTGPIGCDFTFLAAPGTADPVTLAQLKRDLQEAIREIEELEKAQGTDQVDAALKEIDAASKELSDLRAEVAKRKNKSQVAKGRKKS